MPRKGRVRALGVFLLEHQPAPLLEPLFLFGPLPFLAGAFQDGTLFLFPAPHLTGLGAADGRGDGVSTPRPLVLLLVLVITERRLALGIGLVSARHRTTCP